MFSKFTLSLAMAISLMLTSTAFAQTAKKNDSKKTATDAKATEAKLAEASMKAEEEKAASEKAMEAKRAEEAKMASDKAKAEDSAGFLGYMKSHFSASYHGEFYLTRNVDFDQARAQGTSVAPDPTGPFTDEEIKLQDLRILHNPTVIYRPIPNWKLLVTSEFKYTDAVAQGTYINRHYRSLILLTRENVLTEKDDGIKMDLTIGRRIFDRNKGAAGSYGNTRVNASFSKKFGEKLSTSLLAQYLANDPVHAKVASTTWKHSLELVPSFTFQITDKLSYFFNDDFIINTPWITNDFNNISISHEMNIGVVTYQFNDKNSAYFQFKYLHTAAPFQEVSAMDDWFEYYIGYTYSVTPKFSITPEVGSEIFRAKDNRSFFAEKLKYPEFAIYVDLSL